MPLPAGGGIYPDKPWPIGVIMPFTLNKIVAFTCAVSLLLHSCIRDDGDCPDPVPEEPVVVLRLYYMHNMEQVDRFGEEVAHTSLYIFDGDEQLHSVTELPTAQLEDGNTVALGLPAGGYTVVAWGNTHTDDYEVTCEGTLREMTTSMASDADGTVPVHPGHMFHALAQFDHDGVTTTYADVPMVKNTNRVDVLIYGLEPDPQQDPGDIVTVSIQGTNGVYGYDRSLPGSDPLKYKPEYGYIDDDGEQVPAASFVVQRIVEDGDLMLSSVQPGYLEPMINKSLPELIKENYTGSDFADYLDREDHFTVRIAMEKMKDGSYVVVSIQINNWAPIIYDNISVG
ncbi:MAG: FimB/Mfa2 family fimbrial subunit [Rikenellaceae bacterium]|nr:FimB/Mfa2 family fimbrial subunit [Rikenellaceae bacterium]